MKKTVSCEACGGSAVPHRLTYISIVIDSLIEPLIPTGTGSGGWAARFIHWVERVFIPPLFSFLLSIGLAKKIDAPDEHTLLLAKVLWEEALARGIPMFEMRLFGLPRNLFMATLPGGKRVVFEGLPLPKEEMLRAPWMDDKARLKREFRKQGFPIAHGGSFWSLRSAKKFFNGNKGTFIAKPHSGSGSRHTVLHIDTEQKLEEAFRIAKQVSPYVVVEEELVGPVYRATVVNGRFVALLRRDPPHVIGDGIHTVRQLVEAANQHPGRSGPYFSQIQINERAREELTWQGMTPDSVPEAGKRVTLHQKVNWSLGGTTADATDDVHPDNIALFEAATNFLRAHIAGIDFIIADPKRSWKEQNKCGFLECNSMPFFDNHHLPFEGTPRNVAAAIWDMNGA